MNLSKAFDTIKHDLLLAELHAYGFCKKALKFIHNYLRNRWHRTTINKDFSNSKVYNVYLKDLYLGLLFLTYI